MIRRGGRRHVFWSGLEAGREAWKVGERSRRRRGGVAAVDRSKVPSCRRGCSQRSRAGPTQWTELVGGTHRDGLTLSLITFKLSLASRTAPLPRKRLESCLCLGTTSASFLRGARSKAHTTLICYLLRKDYSRVVSHLMCT